MQAKITSRSFPLLIYFLLAVPFESLLSFPMVANPPYKNWLLLLYLGPLLEATVILLALFALWNQLNKKERYVGDTPEIKHRDVFIVVGIAVGGLTIAAWWRIFLYLTQLSGKQSYILGKMPFELGYYPGEMQASISFAIAFSVFTAVILGFVGGDLMSRWSQRERNFIWKLQFTPSLAWDLWIMWIAFYRLSLAALEIVYIPATHAGLGNSSVDGMVLLSIPYVGTALTCIPASIWLAKHRPATRFSAKRSAFVVSLLVNLSVGIFLLVLGWIGISLIALCVLTLNFPGWAWSWIAGEMRWRAVRAEPTNMPI